MKIEKIISGTIPQNQIQSQSAPPQTELKKPAHSERVSLSHKAKEQLKEPAVKHSAAHPHKAEHPRPKDWTVLVYFAGDNDLEKYEALNLIDMEKAGSTKDLNLVAQIDRGPEPSLELGGKAEAVRYYITNDNDDQHINSVMEKSLGKVNSADSKVLADFLSWGMKKYPAKNYLVLLNNHGAGFAGVNIDSSEKQIMKIPQLREALEQAEKDTGVKKDQVMVGFDACVMGQAEVAYELKDVAKMMVASEEVIGGTGWPYHNVFAPSNVAKASHRTIYDVNMKRMAKNIIEAAKDATDSIFSLSAIGLKNMEQLKEALNNMGKALLETKVPRSQIAKVFKASQHYTNGMEDKPYSEMRDIYDLAKRLKKSPDLSDPQIKKAARQLMAAVKECVIYETHTPQVPDSNGLSIYAPVHKGGYDNYHYQDLALAKDTVWDEAMQKFTGQPKESSKKIGNYRPPREKRKSDVA